MSDIQNRGRDTHEDPIYADEVVFAAYSAVADTARRHGWTREEAREMIAMLGLDRPEYALQAKRALRAIQTSRGCVAGTTTLPEAS